MVLGCWCEAETPRGTSRYATPRTWSSREALLPTFTPHHPKPFLHHHCSGRHAACDPQPQLQRRPGLGAGTPWRPAAGQAAEQQHHRQAAWPRSMQGWLLVWQPTGRCRGGIVAPPSGCTIATHRLALQLSTTGCALLPPAVNGDVIGRYLAYQTTDGAIEVELPPLLHAGSRAVPALGAVVDL